MTEFIDKLAYLSFKDKKVLVSLTRGKDTWYIPGGKREAGESDHEALIREVEEEISVRLRSETIKYYGTFEAQAHGKAEGIIVRMTCYTGDYDGAPVAANEIAAIDYFNSSQVGQTGPVDHLIFADLKESGLIT